MLQRIIIPVLCILALSAAACDLDVADLNNPALDDFRESPTPAGANALAVGLLIGHRLDYADNNGFILILGILGREAYSFDPADPRYITELLRGPLDPGGVFGGAFWATSYRNIRTGNVLLEKIDDIEDFSAEEKSGLRGYTYTMQALAFLKVIVTHAANGAVIDVDRPVGEELAPIVSEAEVYDHIVMLLDDGAAELEKAGEAFSFDLPLPDFGAPASFRQFNRAIRARVSAYIGSIEDSDEAYQEALDALMETFVSTATPLDFGAYHQFSANANDQINDLTGPTIYVHPSIVQDAPRQASGELDARVQRKVAERASRTVQGLTSMWGITPLYPSPSSPVAIIRNEELILIRAEANLALGNTEAALEDLNFIRVNSGNLAPLETLPTNPLEELWRQRRYSLLLEGGHSWIDARRFGLLNLIPIDRAGDEDTPSDVVFEQFPIPKAETDARL